MSWVHLHLMLIHFPIAGAFLASAMIVLALFRGDRVHTLLALQVILLVGLITIPAYLTGEPSEGAVEHLSGVSEALIDKHEDAALFALIATELMAALALGGLWIIHSRKTVPRRLMKTLFLISLFNIAVIAWVANLGGQIRHTEIRGEAVTKRATFISAEFVS